MTHPLVMGIVNASPDSFSDPGPRTLDGLRRQAHAQVEAGAELVDVGGESGVTGVAPVAPEVEIERVCPLVEQLAGDGVEVSVDTWRVEVARAALEAGARLVNDVSGLHDPALADACAEHGARLVITHTRVPPKVKAFPGHPDVVGEVEAFLAERIATACARGVDRDRVIVDPGLDLGKMPRESVELLRNLGRLTTLGPVLLAASRKDFLGAITGRAPRERLAATLAAVGFGVDAGAAIVRVHDVAEAVDFLRVRDAVAGGARVPDALPPELRREDPAA